MRANWGWLALAVAQVSAVLATPTLGTLQGRLITTWGARDQELVLEREALPFCYVDCQTVRAEAAGGFLFRNLAAGRYRLRWGQSSEQYLTFDPAAPPLLTLEGNRDPHALLRLAARTPDGQPARHCLLPLRIAAFTEREAPSLPAESPLLMDRRQHSLPLHLNAVLTTDDQGGAQVDVPTGVLVVRLGHDSPAQWLWLRDGQTSPVVEAQGRFEPPAGRVAGTEVGPEDRECGRQAGTILCRVLDPAGRPLRARGVYVFVNHAPAVEDCVPGSVADGFRTTDATGRVTLAERQVGGQQVWAKAAGWAASEPMSVEVVAGRSASVTLRLKRPAGVASGQVLDGDGRPAAGIAVYARRRDPGAGFDHGEVWHNLLQGGEGRWYGGRDPWRGPLPVGAVCRPGELPGLLRYGLSYTLTGGDGRFTFDQLDRGTYDFYAAHETGRRDLLEARTVAERPLSGLTLRLPRPAELEVRVLDGQGQPCAGRAVRACQDQGRVHRAGQTDARGLATFADLAPGDVQCGLSDSRERSVDTWLTGGETTCLDLCEPGSPPVELTVTAPDGRPAAGALLVRFVEPDSGPNGAVWTDANGRATVPLGPWDARAPGLSQVLVLYPGAAAVWFDTTQARTLRLVAGAPVNGRLRDPAGHPLSAALDGRRSGRVPPRREPRASETPDQPDRDGWFSLLPRPLGPATLDVRTWAGDETVWLEADQDFAESRGRRGAGFFHLTPTVTVAPDAPPLLLTAAPRAAGALVLRLRPGLRVTATVADLDYTAVATADDNGRCVFARLPAGPVELHFRGADERPEHLTARVVAGTQTTLGGKLGQPLPVGSVTGVVVDDGGQPQADVRVQLTPAGEWTPVSLTTDPAGRFACAAVPLGAVEVALSEDRQPPVTVTVSAGSAATVKLVDTRPVRGRLRGVDDACLLALDDAPRAPDGRWLLPAEATLIYVPRNLDWSAPEPLRPAGGAVPRLLGDLWAWDVYPAGSHVATRHRSGYQQLAAGETAFQLAAEPGRYRLRACPHTSGRPWFDLGEVTVPSPPARTLALWLPPATGALAVRVANAPRAHVTLCERRSRVERGSAWPDKRSGGTLAPLVPGEYVALVGSEGRAPLKLPVTVAAGRSTTLNVRLGEGVSLRGTVRGAARGPLYVSAEGDTGYGAGYVDSHGRFRLARLQPGTYSLTLWSPGELRLVTRPGVRVPEDTGVALEW